MLAIAGFDTTREVAAKRFFDRVCREYPAAGLEARRQETRSSARRYGLLSLPVFCAFCAPLRQLLWSRMPCDSQCNVSNALPCINRLSVLVRFGSLCSRRGYRTWIG
jgi:hypothetical protein